MAAPLWTHQGERYGDDISYQRAAAWLNDGPVEDWGGGPGYARRYFTHGYTLVDGTPGYGADIVIDLVGYRSHVHGILLRHVLEHNLQWVTILANALASCQKLVLVVFTPFSDLTHVITWNENVVPRVPDISFRQDDLTAMFNQWQSETFKSATQYGEETIFYVRT